MDLRSVTYSQFDNIVGTKLLYSYPEVLSREVFESVSDYVIVGKHLCGKIIIVKTGDIQFVNFPMAIENSKYERNALLFSFGFVLDVDADAQVFEPILRKISHTFLKMELEREFLFQESTRSTISEIARILYEDIRSTGEAFIDIDPCNVLAVKLMNPIRLPPAVKDCDVPILCVDRNHLAQLPWDISLRHVLNYIDGISYVKQIASGDAAMDIDIVKRCIQTLSYYHCIVISDILCCSNMYRLTTDGIQQLRKLHESPLIPELLQFCSISGISNNSSKNGTNNGLASSSNSIVEADSNSAAVKAIQKFIGALRPGRKLSQVILQHGKLMHGIVIRRLLAYCQHRSWIKRIHEYPVDLLSFSSSNSATNGINSTSTAVNAAVSHMNLTGLYSLDHICTEYDVAPINITSVRSVAVIMK